MCEWTLCVCVIRMDLCNVKMFQISSLEPALVTLFLVPYNRFLLEGCHPASNSGRSCGRMFWVASRCDVTVSYHAGRKHVWICKIWNRMELYEDLVDLNLHEEKHRTKWIVLIFTEGLGGGKGYSSQVHKDHWKSITVFFGFPFHTGREEPHRNRCLRRLLRWNLFEERIRTSWQGSYILEIDRLKFIPSKPKQ